MPPVQIPTEDSSAFTVINHEEDKREDALLPLPRIVNVVKPLQHDDARTHPPSASKHELTAPPAPAPASLLAPNTILDPKFSRALDFKLRRLKEKEVLQTNLRRPTRYKTRNGALAASDPNVSDKEASSRPAALSRSHPRLDTAASPTMEPRRARPRPAPGPDKPRFVTTVKAGQFLLPPPEIACLLGLEALYPPQQRGRIVYSYSSKPRAVAPGPAPPAPGPAPGPPRPAPGAVFSGVRALVAGVAGMAHLLDEPRSGSMTQYANVMHDKRVVRGSTFGSHPLAAGDGAARAGRSRRRARARLRPGSPPPAAGRRHLPVQTDYYLEELFDKGEEMEVGVQTDLFADRPATPAYAPAKTGADASTQIYPGDLFDFDLEVQPILEVLVGKTAEQALAEVAQEEELGALREQQRRFRELRDAERGERARLAAAHRRLQREKARRVGEARAAAAAAGGARARAAAAALVQGHVAELLPAVLAGLRDQGYLVERTQRGIDEEFMPWLIAEVSQEIESIVTSRDVISEIVREVVDGRAVLFTDAGEREAAREPPEDSVTPLSVSPEGEEMPFLED